METRMNTPDFQQSSKPKKKVLSEEEYVSTLEKIIERDYFGDTKLHRKLLQELEHDGNRGLMKGLSSRVRDAAQFDRSSIDRVHREDGENELAHDSVNIDGLTLQSFFHAYTSEDNDSFQQLHEKDLEEHRKMFHWMYENPNSYIENGPSMSESSNAKAGMLMLYYVGGKVLTPKERLLMDKILNKNIDEECDDPRVNMGTSNPWKFQVQNQLLFVPTLDGSRSTHNLPAISCDDDSRYYPLLTDSAAAGGATLLIKDSAHNQVMLPPTKTLRQTSREKQIQRKNTSFGGPDLHNEIITVTRNIGDLVEPPHTPTTTDGSVFDDSDWEDDAVSDKFPVSKLLQKRKSHERVEVPPKKASSYSLVPMSPSIDPDELQFSPLMVYGTIAGPPISVPYIESSVRLTSQNSNLSSSSLGGSSLDKHSFLGPHFEMPALSSREKLARDLGTRATFVKDVIKQSPAFSLGLPSTPLRTPAKGPIAMSPAAKALADRIQKTAKRPSVW